MVWSPPWNWPAATDLTAPDFNREIRDNFKALTTWSAYTPTLTNWTLGNGTLTGSAIQAGKLVHATIQYVVGSTDTPSGTFRVSLPSTAVVKTTNSNYGTPVGEAFLFDNSASARRYWMAILAAGGSDVVLANPDGSATVSHTSPWTWATDDEITISVTYEAV